MPEHPINILHYVGVRHPHNPEALASQPSGSAPVILLLQGMRFAIDLDYQLRLGAEEIGNEGA